MEKKVMIVQSIPEWLCIFKSIILQELPELAGHVVYTDSFDQAIDLVPKDGEIIVISSWMFHDKSSAYRMVSEPKIPDAQKNGERLAEMIKEINPNTKFFIFSEYTPENKDFIDGYIPKQRHGNIETADVLKVLGNNK